MVLDADPDVLRPVQVFLPDWSQRRINDAARAGRLPGVKKVGREWMISRSAAAALQTKKVDPVEDAAAVLRACGVAV